ncbi:asparagine synthase-related protein [Salipaludibacillus aurantiacus]|uniref:asparagine synthase (glutamine-hydrolyzing) n=1 Tax=Salipaludibacillus aurantiacus TaxID=1601833 RepID=A0A1H9UL41_9BACI|nr:asparagine synthase-related protein [Salipaludibacillus aurantiacus]SES10018.1 asparagine synthase (glutamine-hydrolysing) [Salipaludibacillus aurantiacus]
MSAIAGLIHFNNSPVSNEQTTDLMKGFECFPADDVRGWQKSNAFLGCHAQWITPESVGEPLPYYDYERQLVITADAIIDNREELCEKLQIEKAYRQNIPDSRLILLAYSKWGEEAPKQLVGDFAFMIWDERQQRLFGARDFSGARTLYYCFKEGRLAFSTLIAPLFTLPGIDKKVKEEWMAEFLAIPGMVEAVDMNHTVYERIMQVPPSHSISVCERGVRLSRYNVLNLNEKIKLKSDAEYEEAFRDVFGRAVKDRLRTYGKVGSQLSGGLDSGSVAGFAARELKKENKQLHTFSFIPKKGFQDWTPHYLNPDESIFIRQAVAHIGNINPSYLSFEGKSPLSEVDSFLELMEMPYKFFGNSFWAMGINKEAQQQGIKILLNGARGNHSISWGSRKLTFDYYNNLLKKGKWSRLYREIDDYCRHFQTGKSVVIPFIVKRGLRSRKTRQSDELPFAQFISPELAKKTDVFEKLKGSQLLDNHGYDETYLRHQHFTHHYSWNKTGVITTKLSLRYAMWERDPTNDLRVIRFCLSIPHEQYVTGGMERSLIRRATKDLLPDSIRLNQHTRGFQGGDVIERMKPEWNAFVTELQHLVDNPATSYFIDVNVLKRALSDLPNVPAPNLVFSNDFKILTRSLIVSRFIQQVEKGGDYYEKDMERAFIGST